MKDNIGPILLDAAPIRRASGDLYGGQALAVNPEPGYTLEFMQPSYSQDGAAQASSQESLIKFSCSVTVTEEAKWAKLLRFREPHPLVAVAFLFHRISEPSPVTRLQVPGSKVSFYRDFVEYYPLILAHIDVAEVARRAEFYRARLTITELMPPNLNRYQTLGMTANSLPYDIASDIHYYDSATGSTLKLVGFHPNPLLGRQGAAFEVLDTWQFIGGTSLRQF
jgi:hypothetical protein